MRLTRPRLSGLHAALLAGAVGVCLVTGDLDRWPAAPLLLIALFTTGSELLTTRLDGESGLSGTMVGIVLTAALYGPGPAGALATVVILVGWPRTREPPVMLFGNLVSLVWPALVAAFIAHDLVGSLAAGDPLRYLGVFAAFLAAESLNLLGVVGLVRTWRGVRDAVRTAVGLMRPVFAAELFSALLSVAAVWIVVRMHTVGIVMLGVVFAIFQYLVGELLTSRRRGEKLRRIATTDELTGLPNRERFRETIEARIDLARRTEAGFSVMLMDLDHFKEVNDALGHAYGDHLLRDLGPRLQAALGEGGFVARLGGDEFGIVPAEDCAEPASLEATVARLITAIGEPFEVDELSLEVGASIGVARFPDDGEDSDGLMRCSDIAMYAAKDAQTDFKLYAAEQNAHSMRRLSVLSDIRRALAGDEIVVHYQPIVDLEDRCVIGAEGLVRWEHPEHGLIPPGAFVATVEQSGLIGPLTRHVLEHSIAQCADWRRAGRDMSVAVNLSVRNLLDRDLPREIERMLAHHGVPAAALQLEITESMIMSDPERALATVSRLSSLGVRLSVDDFGTGYSSLANLRRLPINELKIDRSFVSPMLDDESDLIIVRSTINLGHDLGLRIIAEGVEDSATLERLATLGCDRAQGFHLSRPMAAAAFTTWLAGRAASAAPAGAWSAAGRTTAPRLVTAAPHA